MLGLWGPASAAHLLLDHQSQRVAEQAAAHKGQLAVPKQWGARVERLKLLPRQRLMGRPRADKGPLAVTAAVAKCMWKPVVTGTRILGALLGARQRTCTLGAMVFGAPGPPGVAALVVRAA